ncbi:glycosyl hydrolase [Dactylosporangium sp. CA-092794]|uniref:glycosyl hydrolase n=1 Tax=Dactylosporangium sp. CA-092794 TaxID=3239929 RepID=UPI003D8F1A53
MILRRRTTGALLGVALAAIAMVVATAVSARSTTTPSKPAPPAATLGIYKGGSASQGQHPNIVNEYYAWGDTSISALLNSARSQGATPFIEMEPWTQSSASNCTVSMSGIASNASSNVTYEKAIGTAIANFGHPVILTFAHEFNVSGQYPWAVGGGCNTSSSQWISAWKSVVTNVNSTAGQNAYWMWAPNADTGGSTQSPAPWWPGGGYVDMVGIDGYPDTEWGSQFGTFSGEFGRTFSDIRGAGWSGPIFISETNLARLGSSGYESMTGFVNDLLNAGGSGVLEFEDPSWGAPTMTSQQWTELDNAIAAHTGGGARPTSSGARPTSSGARPTSSGARPTSSGEWPTGGGARPTSSGEWPPGSTMAPPPTTGTSPRPGGPGWGWGWGCWR